MPSPAATHATAAGSTERAVANRRQTELGSVAEKSVVLDRVYDEYCRRRAAGEKIDHVDFARRYSRYQRSILLLLEVHQFIEGNPELLADAPEAPWPEVGDDFLGFKLLDELGRGTFARVFLASETDLSRLVAVKVAQDSSEEAQLIARLAGHANIVPIHSVKTEPSSDRTLICMPYLGRATLCDLLDQVIERGVPRKADEILAEVLSADERYPVTEAPSGAVLPTDSYVRYVLSVGAELARALAHTHNRGLVHGDLKPSNILLVTGGRPMLLDFNLSLKLGDVSRLGGTLPYIAPEQLQALVDARHGEAWDALDERCDLYSLGAILYELLTGTLPFAHPKSNAPLKSLARELLLVRRTGPQPIRELNPLVDRRTAKIVERCLRFDPAERPQTAEELAKELSSAASLPARATAWADCHRGLVSIFATCFVCLLFGVGVWWVNRPTAAVRYYREAVQLYDQGDYAAALPLATASLDANNGSANAYFLRGRVRQANGLYSEAIDDFVIVEKMRPEFRAIAGKAYCFAKLRRHLSAVGAASLALKYEAKSAPLVMSNMAHSYRMLSKWNEAIHWASRAIERNDRLQPAFHTRAIAIRSGYLAGQPLSIEQAGQDIERAIELGPTSGDLYFDAASIELIRAQANPQHVSAAPGYLTEAVHLGTPVTSIKRHPLIKNLDLPAVTDTVQPGRRSAEFLIDPIPDDTTHR